MTTLAPPKEVVLTTYEDVRAALANEDLARSLDPEKYEKGNIKEGVISLLHGSEHRERRRVENTLFRRDTLELYERVLFPDIVAHTLETFVDPDRSDLMEIGWLMTCVLAARTAGVDFDRESFDQRQRLRYFLRLFAVGGAIDVAKGDVEELKTLMRATIADFDAEFVAPSKARRLELVERFERGEIGEDELPRDMLTTLLHNRAELRMDEGLLLRETTTFFTAGAHTSTQTMTNTLHQLFEWCDGHPEDWDRLATDSYFVQRSVQEALRCRPTNPLIHRRALRDTVIRGHEIEEGTRVLLDTISANADSGAYGANAARFDPHRVYPPGMPPYGTSFGGGIHLCMGRTLAVGLPVREPGWIPDDGHLYGLVSQAVQALVRRGVAPDPERPPVRDEQTTRWTRWADYPVIFEASRARLAAGV